MQRSATHTRTAGKGRFMCWLHHACVTKKMAESPLESVVTERLNPKTGLVEPLPILHPSSCEDVSFLPYLSPMSTPVWEEAIQQLDCDLHWLLKLPHSKFWAQVVFDSSLKRSLESFLQNAPRSYDRLLNLPLKVQDTQRNIRRRVFMTFLRMSTAKESEAHYFTPAAHADIIYNNYLFDVPKLMDLCVLYGGSNRPLLSKMVDNVFKIQPKYLKDWAQSVLSFSKIFKKMSDKVLPVQGAVRLTEKPKALSPDELTDIIVYLSDLGSTLKAFLDVYPPSVAALIERGFLDTLVGFYESVMPTLQRQWLTERRRVADASYVKTRFRQFKINSAWIVNRILCLYFDPSPGASDEPSDSSLDDFITAVTLVFTEKNFLREYEKHYSLSSLVLEIQQQHPELPESHFNYIISSLEEEPKVKKKPATSVPSGLISQVKELLPHLGEGFIQLCLKEYGDNPETVVDHVLEGNLPPHLRDIDQCASLEEIGTGSSSTKAASGPVSGKGSPDVEATASLLEERLNVYDNDEFDVFNKDVSVDLSRVHFGKRHKPTSDSAVFDDKAHLADTRSTYRQYEIETEWSYEQPIEGGGLGGAQWEGLEFDQYSDEYDDTYDSHLVGAADNDSSEELFTVRRLNDKGQFSQHFSQFPDPSEQNPNDRQATNPPTSGHVTVLKRSPHEQKGPSKPKTSPHKPKGQSTETKPVEGDRARQLKDRNKAKRANHSRKAMADKKRARGMGAPPRT